MSESIEVYSVGKLRELLADLPADRMVIFQVAATDGTAWSLSGAFCPQVRGGSFAVVTLTHLELTTMPSWPSTLPAQPAAAWQPIETAPKDGTDILLWPTRWPKKLVSAGYWNEGSSSWSLLGDLAFNPQSPTHWLPYASPPKETST